MVCVRTATACAAAMGVLLLSLGCHPNRPIVDLGPRPDVGGTISGTVNASGAVPVSGRQVTAINVETGERLETSTTTTGGYTIRVPAGTYRLELEARPGEEIASAPDPTEVDAGDLDAGRDFTLAVSGPN